MRINSTKPSLLKEVVSSHEAAAQQLSLEYQQQQGQQLQQQLPRRPSDHEINGQALQRVQEDMAQTLQQAG